MPPLMESFRRVGRSILPNPLFAAASRGYNWFAGVRQLGFGGYSRLRNLASDYHPADGTFTELTIPSLMHPIAVRNGSSDVSELIHTILRRTYEPFTPAPGRDVRFVIDAGANIGDTAAWFLTRYPAARVVSLEPDSRNFEVLVRNTSAYGDRSIRLNFGLWPRSANLRVVESESRTALSVVEVAEGQPFDCKAVSPTDLLAQTGSDWIDIFKIDIEGAEQELFAAPDADAWLARTGMIMMEIHGPAEWEAVSTAVARHRFVHHRHREVHIFVNRNGRKS